MRASCLFRRWPAAFACWILFAGGMLPARAQNGGLEPVLDAMDRAHTNFRSAEANFVWKQYTSVVQDTDIQKGTVHYRREGNEIQMALEITEPYPKSVLLMKGKLQLFEPRLDRVTVYDAQKNESAFESFLVLGFGGGGHALEKSYSVKYLGTEKVEGIETAKLDLVPRIAKVQNMFPHITLWVDPARGIAVQQQLFQQGGDYRLAQYSDIQLNHRIPDSVFKLKTNGKTVFEDVSPSH